MGCVYLFVPHMRVPRNQMQVIVRDNNVDQALRALKRKMQREGIFREIKDAALMRSRLKSA